MAKNVLGTDLKNCSTAPKTGYYRTGCCDTGPGDFGVHGVCAKVTAEFLAFSQSMGNAQISIIMSRPLGFGRLFHSIISTKNRQQETRN